MRYRLRTPDQEISAIKYNGKNGDEIRELIDDDKKVRFDAQGRMFVGNYKSYVPVNIGEFVGVNKLGEVRRLTADFLYLNFLEVHDE